MKERLDILVVKKGIVDSRSKSSELIKSSKICVNGNIITKPSYLCNIVDDIKLIGEKLKYVSRGGLKLETAINKFNLDFHDKCILDIGSSTGGFTDCALQNGASKVVSVDVGSNQIHPSLLGNPKIDLHEKTDIRNLDIKYVNDCEICVIDVSFISVTKFIDIICTYPKLDMIVCLIKPQFECGKETADKYKGIILNKEIHKSVITNVVNTFKNYNFYLNGLTPSSIKGGDGNIEYLALFEKDKKEININYGNIINEAFKK